MMMYLVFCLLFVVVGVSSGSPSSQHYLATIHHSSANYLTTSKRNIEQQQFVGDLIINNTLNENGEITISLCDITNDLFNGKTATYQLFNYEKTAGVASVASATLTANLNVNVNVDGCIQFFLDPCCETVGVRFVLNDPVVLSATGTVEVGVEAFGIGGHSLGTNDDINYNPLGNINLAGFSPVIGSWKLPSILDPLFSTKISNEQFCAGLSVPGSSVGLKFCVLLNNFTASLFAVNVCPRLTITFGSETLLDISYTGLPGLSGSPECLSFSFLPQCPSYTGAAGASLSPDIVQLFKSIDLNNDFKLVEDEITKSKALLGVYSTKDSNQAAFLQMDGNTDNGVDFAEFQQYTATQSQTYDTSPNATPTTSFTQGDIALAVIMTMLATAIVASAVLVAVAQYKGIVKFGWLSKIIPTRV